MQPGSVRHRTTLTTPRSKRNASTSPMSQMLIGLPIDRLQGSTTRSRCAISSVVSIVMVPSPTLLFFEFDGADGTVVGRPTHLLDSLDAHLAHNELGPPVVAERKDIRRRHHA